MNLICGINPVLEALHAGTRHFERLLVVKGLRNKRISDAITAASGLGVPLRFESRETLDRLSAGVPHQGIMAVVSAKPVMDLETLLAQARDPALLVALDGVEDPRNLGAIMRTAEAAGADGVLLPQRHSAGLTDVVNRASAGALEHVRVARVANMTQTLARLKERGIWIVGFDAAGQERWDAVDLKGPVALVLGGEGRGIRRLVRESCDHLVSLPLFGHVSSLNVSVAAGIALYEAIRQRGLVPSHVRPIPLWPTTAQAGPAIQGPRADDEELDPGQSAPHQVETADLESGEAGPVVRLHDEELAWGSGGTTVVRGGIERRGEWARRGRRDDRERRGRKKRGRPEGRPGEARPVDAPEARAPRGPEQGAGAGPDAPAAGPGPAGRRRRRRGRKRGSDGAAPGDAAGTQPRNASDPRRASGDETQSRREPSAEGAGAQPGRDEAQARHRRRRRHRRGGPGPGSGSGAPPQGGGGEA